MSVGVASCVSPGKIIHFLHGDYLFEIQYRAQNRRQQQLLSSRRLTPFIPNQLAPRITTTTTRHTFSQQLPTTTIHIIWPKRTNVLKCFTMGGLLNSLTNSEKSTWEICYEMMLAWVKTDLCFEQGSNNNDAIFFIKCSITSKKKNHDLLVACCGFSSLKGPLATAR